MSVSVYKKEDSLNKSKDEANPKRSSLKTPTIPIA